MSKDTTTPDEKIVANNPNGEAADVTNYKAFSADQFFAQALNLKTEFVPLPEIGGGIWIRELTGLQRDKYEETLIQGKGKNRRVSLQGARARLIIFSAVEGPDPALVEAGKADPPGADAKPLFRMSNIAQINSLGASFVEPLAEAARRLSGITDDETEAVEDLKNDD